MIPSMESWKAEAQYIKSRCGFCGLQFDKWQDRVDHLAKEFRNGATMKDWKGCRGLDPHVAAQVTNAMPPYLIAMESMSPFPFSATNSSSMRQHNLCLQQGDLESVLPNDRAIRMQGTDPMECSISPTTANNTTPQSVSTQSLNANATCWEILTLRLGRYARLQIEKNGPSSVSDAMLQSEARRILYGEDDPWHQTAADNPEWLNLFKKAHGINNPPVIAPNTTQHNLYDSLGVRRDAQLDQSFNIDNFDCVTSSIDNPAMRSFAFECSLAGSTSFSRTGATCLSPTMPDEAAIATTSAAFEPPITTFADLHGITTPVDELGAGGFCLGEDGELGLATSNESSLRQSPTTALACTKALDSFMTSIAETPCNVDGEPCQAELFPSWQQISNDLGLPDVSTNTSCGLPFVSGSDALELSNGTVIEGTVGNAPIMGWDDHELAFDMDMDMDLEAGANKAI